MEEDTKDKAKKIVLTGGHAATTALATIIALREQDRKWDISWIGSRNALEGKKLLSLEFKTFPDYGVDCYNIIAGRLQRKLTRHSLLSVLKIPIGFLNAYYLILKLRPKAVLSFGGFAALPVVVASWTFGIPIVIHDQTAAAGMANRLSAPFARKVAIARVSSEPYFPKRKTVLVGNPVSPLIVKVQPKTSLPDVPTIYVTGGSRGSEILNKHVFEAIPTLIRNYKLIHQCGDNDYAKACEVKKSLPAKMRSRYHVFAFIPPLEVPEVFNEADIVVGRAGANTVAEVMVTQRPSIFVPIPWAQNDEQTKNAKLAVEAGLAKIIYQKNLSTDSLVKALYDTKRHWARMVGNPRSDIAQLDLAAANRLARIVFDLVK